MTATELPSIVTWNINFFNFFAWFIHQNLKQCRKNGQKLLLMITGNIFQTMTLATLQNKVISQNSGMKYTATTSLWSFVSRLWHDGYVTWWCMANTGESPVAHYRNLSTYSFARFTLAFFFFGFHFLCSFWFLFVAACHVFLFRVDVKFQIDLIPERGNIPVLKMEKLLKFVTATLSQIISATE